MNFSLPHISFMKYRHIAVSFSVITFFLTIGAMFWPGLNFGIDFTGGTLVQIQTDGPKKVADIRAATAAAGLKGLSIQEYGAPDEFLVRAPASSENSGEFAAHLQKILVSSALPVEVRRVEFVGPQVGDELKRTGLLAVLFSLVAILVYVTLRFEFSYAVGTLAATVHDAILTIGVFIIMQTEFSLPVLAALLTVIGYSINDTIVIFDRVRENRHRHRKMDLTDLLDLSLNETLRRTILTSGTTLIAVLSLWALGGEVIHDFAFTLLFGVFVGTYSSIFVAAPIYQWVHNRTKHWAIDDEESAEKKEEPEQKPKKKTAKKGAKKS